MIALLLAACVLGPIPDRTCTPGATLPVAKEQICVKGYAKTARNVSSAEKRAAMKAYGVDPKKHPKLEIDHLISLELGGSNDIRNLWPEMQDPRPGFREKDLAENALHAAVCRGDISLKDAQRLISTDWKAAFAKYVRPKGK